MPQKQSDLYPVPAWWLIWPQLLNQHPRNEWWTEFRKLCQGQIEEEYTTLILWRGRLQWEWANWNDFLLKITGSDFKIIVSWEFSQKDDGSANSKRGGRFRYWIAKYDKRLLPGGKVCGTKLNIQFLRDYKDPQVHK